jgi:molybdopterin converting factor subunit 1
MTDSTLHDKSNFSLQILLFGALKDAAGTPAVTIEAHGEMTVEALLERLCAQYPSIAKYLPHTRVAVNYEYCNTSQQVKEGDEIALIPPVAGG